MELVRSICLLERIEFFLKLALVAIYNLTPAKGPAGHKSRVRGGRKLYITRLGLCYSAECIAHAGIDAWCWF